MAEAHQAVAFQFTVTPEGLDFHLSREAVRQLYLAAVHSWKKRLVRAKNSFLTGVYPASPSSWMVVVMATAGSCYCQVDPSLGLIARIQRWLPRGEALTPQAQTVVSTVVFSTGAWLAAVLLFRRLLRLLLSYHGWMFEPHGHMSRSTRLWIALMKIMSIRKPLLYSFQSSLPKLPVPPVKATVARYLESVRPLLDDDKYLEMAALAKEFQEKTAPRLQRYLRLKSWWTTNYVSVGSPGDSGDPAAFGAVASELVSPPSSMRRDLGSPGCPGWSSRGRGSRTHSLSPLSVPVSCPFHLSPSLKHLAVYHKGRYYKVWLYYGGQLLPPADLEMQFQRILDDPSPPQPGEERLAALTAGERVPWAEARARFFSRGPNKAALDAIERAAFFLTLDEEEHGHEPARPGCMDAYAKSLLHGRCYDRCAPQNLPPLWGWGFWGAGGVNSPPPPKPNAPCPPQFMLATDKFQLGYTEGGHCKGDPRRQLAPPQRLQWDIPPEGVAAIEASLRVARALAEDVDFCCFPFSTFGKGLIKRCRTSPDAFIQIALQLAHFRDKGSFCLTYEASMTRLFREGRTETVRSCTSESTAFVRSMADARRSRSERQRLFKAAAEKHQQLYRLAMTGAGIDRHLFLPSTLIGPSTHLDVYKRQVLSEPWRLSTSQTPQQQLRMFDLNKFPDHVSSGGGFGPVADDGYGVSYIIAGENLITFHVSSKFSSPETDSQRFGRNIRQAMLDIAGLFDKPPPAAG
ncbi:CPT1B palmitoyltransferase, partial [Vidua chalybeata]|nr:CPT1B palmitoyltransferase [Vidua chalybeata]